MWTEVIEQWLDANERSQAYLARKAGISAEHLNRCLSGKTRIGPRTLRKLERAMGLPLGTLELTPEIPAGDGGEG
jgi:DNA-binding phage protein